MTKFCAAPVHGVAVAWDPSSSITLRLSVLRPGRKAAARDDPKCHYSRLYRAGIFVLVVAQPIQDMSEVPIANKTVGIRLPRLRYGAIGWRIDPINPTVQSSNTSPQQLSSDVYACRKM
jgi:hypothetical protein